MPSSDAKANKRRRFSFVRFCILLVLLLGVFGGALGYWGYKQFEKDLPDRWSELTDYRPSRASRVFSSEGELIGEFFLQKRMVIQWDKIPKHLKQAFVASEDNRFFEHGGIDPLGIMRAAIANAKAGRVVQGGSTITQQVAKLMLVGNERNLFRKIREAILAHKIEVRLTKDQILGIYLNHVYLGHGAYGVQAAAEIYFAKDAQDLTIAEAAMLGGLPKAPTQDSPFSAYKRAKQRQSYVLDQMVENKFISAEDAKAARTESIAILSKDTPLNHTAAPYFVEHIRKMVQHKYSGRQLYDRGLRIYTTLVMNEQRAAEAAVRHGLEETDRRFGFRGPVAQLDDAARAKFLESLPQLYTGPKEANKIIPAAGALLYGKAYLATVDKQGKKAIAHLGALSVVMNEVDAQRIERWAQKKGNHPTPGDLIPVKVTKVEVKKGSGKKQSTEFQEEAQLAQMPELQSALVAMNPADGHLTAMVGGFDYTQSQFNRATQAKRQAGSSIKPYIYSLAVDNGYTEVTIIPDAPVSIPTAAGLWSPHNYKAEYLGPITLRTALQKSINTVCVRIVAALGVDKVIDQIRRFGVTAPIVRHPSVALGTPEVTLLEHTYGYGVFAAGGKLWKPILIEKILDADGNAVEKAETQTPKQVIGDDTAYVMVDMLKNVVEKGTGQKAKELGRPAGGKTGTSNDFRDNWFMAFTRDRVAGVWVGRDDFKPIGYDATGGTTAAPIWTEFMKLGHPQTPVKDFDAPSTVYFVRATPDKGSPARPGTPGSLLMPFKRGTIPREFARTEPEGRFADPIF